jgi:hypothetical protein
MSRQARIIPEAGRSEAAVGYPGSIPERQRHGMDSGFHFASLHSPGMTGMEAASVSDRSHP